MTVNRYLKIQSNDIMVIIHLFQAKYNTWNIFLFFSAVIFKDMPEEVKNSREKRDTIVKLPKHIQYKIRMDVDNIPFTGRIKER